MCAEDSEKIQRHRWSARKSSGEGRLEVEVSEENCGHYTRNLETSIFQKWGEFRRKGKSCDWKKKRAEYDCFGKKGCVDSREQWWRERREESSGCWRTRVITEGKKKEGFLKLGGLDSGSLNASSIQNSREDTVPLLASGTSWLLACFQLINANVSEWQLQLLVGGTSLTDELALHFFFLFFVEHTIFLGAD